MKVGQENVEMTDECFDKDRRCLNWIDLVADYKGGRH